MDKDITIPWLLVASPQLEDPNFKNTVVLMVEENHEGAMGFVVNRPSETPLKELITVDVKIPPAVPAWVGGPVESTTGFILHNQNDITDEKDIDLGEGVILSSSAETLTFMTLDAEKRLDKLSKLDLSKDEFDVDTLYPFRFLAGYAAWASEQLDGEIRRGSWLQIPLNLDILFNCPWNKMWDRAITSIGFKPEELVTPDQPYLN